MAAWNEPDLNDFLPGEPVTAAKMLLMVENPIAIAEGAADAPRIAVSTAVAYGSSDQSFAVPDGYSGAIIEFEGIAAGDDADKFIGFALSSNNGSSYSADTSLNIGNTSSGEWNERLRLFVDFDTGAYKYFRLGNRPSGTGASGSGTMTVPSGTVDRMVFRIGGTDEILRGGFFATLNGGTASS